MAIADYIETPVEHVQGGQHGHGTKKSNSGSSSGSNSGSDSDLSGSGKSSDSGYDSVENEELYRSTSPKVEAEKLDCCVGDGSCVQEALDLSKYGPATTMALDVVGNVGRELITKHTKRRTQKVYTNTFSKVFLFLMEKFSTLIFEPENKLSLLHVTVIEERVDALIALYLTGLFAVMLPWKVSDQDSTHKGLTAEGIVQESKNEKFKKSFSDVKKWESSLNMLQKVIRRGLLEKAQELVRRHPQLLETPAKDGTTAIHWAAVSGNSRIVDLLAAMNVDIEKLTYENESAVMIATKCGHGDLVSHMIEKYKVRTEFEVDSGAQQNSKISLLDIAINNRNEKTIDVVAKKSTDVNIFSIFAAVKTGEANIYDKVKKYVTTGNINTVDSERGETLIHAACRLGQVDVAADLLHKSPQLNSVDYKKQNVLHSAVESGSLDMLRLMIEKLKENDLLQDLINEQNVHNGLESSFMVTGKDKGLVGYHYLEVERGLNQKFKVILKGGGSCDVSVYGSVVKSGWGLPNDEDKAEIEHKYSHRAIRDSNPRDMTPLHYAIWCDQPAMAVALINEGADVTARDCFQMTPGHYAGMRGMRDILTLLHSKRSTLEEKDCKGRSALDVAKLNDKDDMVAVIRNLLTKAKGKCKAKKCSGDGQCALGGQRRDPANQSDLVKSVFQGLAKKAEDKWDCAAFMTILRNVSEDGVVRHRKEGRTVLHAAVAECHQEAILALHYTGLLHSLYSLKVDSNGTTYAKMTACEIAKKLNLTSMTNFLREMRVEEDSMTLMHRLASQGDLRGVKILLQNHEEMKNAGSCSIMFSAVNSGNPEMVKLLQSKNVPVEGTTKKGETLVGRAIKTKNHRMLQHLLEVCRLDGTAQTSKVSPFQLALSLKDAESFKILQRSGVKVESSLLPKVALLGDMELVNLMLNGDANIDQQDPDTGKSALYIACENAKHQLMEFLIKKDANPKTKDFRYRNILHAAIDSKNTYTLQKVIEMLTPAQLKELINERDRYLGSERCFLVSGRDNGTLGYHYIEVERYKLHIFRDIIRRGGSCDVAEYGMVIKSGWGKPTQEVKDFIDKRYRPTEVKVTDPEDMSPLNYAILRELPQMALLLIEKGANIRTVDRFGMTPAHMAAMRGLKDVLAGLKNSGDHFITKFEIGSENHLPIDLARINKHDSCVEFLDEASKQNERNALLDKMEQMCKLLRREDSSETDHLELAELHEMLGQYLKKPNRGEVVQVSESQLPTPVVDL